MIRHSEIPEVDALHEIGTLTFNFRMAAIQLASALEATADSSYLNLSKELRSELRDKATALDLWRTTTNLL